MVRLRRLDDLRVFGRHLTAVTEKREKDRLVENEGKNCTFFSEVEENESSGSSETLAVF